MHVPPVEVLLAAPPHTNADQVLGYEHARLQSVDLNQHGNINHYLLLPPEMNTQPEQHSSKCLQLMTCLHLADNLLTFFDKEFEKQSCYHFPYLFCLLKYALHEKWPLQELFSCQVSFHMPLIFQIKYFPIQYKQRDMCS